MNRSILYISLILPACADDTTFTTGWSEGTTGQSSATEGPGHGTTSAGEDPTEGHQLPELLWKECSGKGADCGDGLQCVAGSEVELDQDGLPHVIQEGAFCSMPCSNAVPCPDGPNGEQSSCIGFPSQPGVRWCYLECGPGGLCPAGLACMTLWQAQPVGSFCA